MSLNVEGRFARTTLLVQRSDKNLRDPIDEPHLYLPRIAAHLAVLDVFLHRSTAGIDSDRDSLAAVRTDDIGRRVRRAVSERKVGIDIRVVALPVIPHEAGTSAKPHAAAL